MVSAASIAPSPPIVGSLVSDPRRPNWRSETESTAPHRDPRVCELKGDVVAALMASGHPTLSFIACEVDQDRVILRGRVQSYHLKQLAQERAQRVEGVRRVDNKLEVLGRASA